MTASKDILQSNFPFLDNQALDLLLEGTALIPLAHKEAILNTGDRIESVYFIAKGMVRGFFINDLGEERTIILRPTKTFFSPPGVLEGATISKYSFEAIQDTDLIAIPLDRFTALAEVNLAVSRLYVEILKENLHTVFFRIELLAGMSPEQRYEKLLEERPELFQKSYHKYVANYLGITPNSLSRIIKRSSQKVAE